MRRWSTLLAVLMVGLAAGPAGAQPPPGPALPPAFSPYLNLVRGGNPAINYFGLVRPQQQLSAAVQQLQHNQANQVNPFAQAAAGGDVATGNPFGFQNYRNYFQNQYTAGGFRSGLGATGLGGPGGAGGAGQPNPFTQLRPGTMPARGRKR